MIGPGIFVSPVRGRRLARNARRVATALGLAVLLFPFPAFADSVSASVESGYGRLVFTLDPPAHAEATQSGGVVSVAFDRKVDLSVLTVLQGLPGYIASVREDQDGKTLRIAVSQSVRLHTSASGDRFAVDLSPESSAGTPPDLPQPPPKERAAVDVSKLPSLAIRAGAYSNYARLVFDWPRATAYTVFRGAGHLTMRFESMARPDFSALASVAPPWVKETGWRIEGNGTVVEFDTDAASSSRDFKDGTKVVLDILAPKSDTPALKPPGDKKTSAARATKPAVSSAATEKAVLDAAAALKGDAPKPAPPAAASTPAPAQASTTAPPPVAAKADASASLPTPSDSGAKAQRTQSGFVLDFPGAGTRAVAAFVRGVTAWIVIDGPVSIDPQHLKAVLGDVPFAASSSNGASVLLVGLAKPAQIAVRAEGSDLKVAVGANPTNNAAAIGFERNEDVARPKLVTFLPGAVHAIRIADPAVGDSLIVVPALPGRALLALRSYAEFSLLPTAAGLSVVPLADDLDVAALGGRVSIGRPRGLALAAPAQPSIDSPAALARSDTDPCFLDFAAWAVAPGSNFLEQERRLRARVANSRPEETGRARLALARFYLAHHFAAEALGAITLIEKDDPALQSDRQLRVMHAAADFMLGRYRDAHNDIAGIAFDGDRHAALWRGLIEAEERSFDAARKDFAQAAPVVRFYMPEWQARVRIGHAKAALASDAIETADAQLAKLPERLPASLALEAQLVRAQLYAAEGRYGDARGIFVAIAQSGNDRTSAEAVFAGVEAGLAAGAISQDVAIDRLEQLRFRWRGDALELATLRKLGALYIAKQRWHEGLATLRIASQNFPNDDLARAAQDDMRATFETLFLKGKADRMSAIQALGLFYDFIDLTPIGPNGDEMIRRMADRLVAVDLLESAASLLDYQVTKRLDGVARAQVATRLAMIDLLDHKPKEALEALRTSQIAGLPADTVHQRTILQARALAALKQWDQALDMIATDDAPDSRRLRADIYWESGNWEIAGEKAEQLAASPSDNSKATAQETRALVMRAAIAYSLAGDETGLGRLRSAFASKMGVSADASAFAVVTQKLDTEAVAFRDTAGEIASIDTLESFMKDFRKRYDTARATN